MISLSPATRGEEIRYQNLGSFIRSSDYAEPQGHQLQ
jgi:hypothetical protein